MTNNNCSKSECFQQTKYQVKSPSCAEHKYIYIFTILKPHCVSGVFGGKMLNCSFSLWVPPFSQNLTSNLQFDYIFLICTFNTSCLKVLFVTNLQMKKFVISLFFFVQMKEHSYQFSSWVMIDKTHSLLPYKHCSKSTKEGTSKANFEFKKMFTFIVTNYPFIWKLYLTKHCEILQTLSFSQHLWNDKGVFV